MGQAVIYCQLRHNLHPCFWDSLKQTRRFWDGDIYLIAPQREQAYTAIDKYGAKFVSEESLSDAFVSEYEKQTFLDYPGWDGFWDLSCKRFFYEYNLMARENIDHAILIEQDVALYAPVSELFADAGEGSYITFIAHCPEQVSCCYRVVSGKGNLKALCDYVLACFSNGTELVRKQSPTQGIINETSLAYLFMRVWPAAKLLPDMPTEGRKLVYDPQAYGVWIGGRHHNPGVPWATEKHYIGKRLLNGELYVFVDVGNMKPYVNRIPLACAHFNGKQIALWI